MANYAYDLEVYPNFFSATFVTMDSSNDSVINDYINADIKDEDIDKGDALEQMDKYVFVINEEENNAFALRDFMSLNPTLFGYNSHNYDDVILNVLLANLNFDAVYINKLLYNTSNELISSQFIGFDNPLYTYKVNKTFVSIDLQKLYHLAYKGLKMVAIQMKWYKIQDLPLNPHKPVPLFRVTELLLYNLNDVLMTRQMIKLKKDELESRVDAMKMYELDSKILSTSRPEMAKMIISHYIQKLNGGDKSFEKERTYRKYIRFEDIVNYYDFQIPEFKSFYERIKQIKILIGSTKFSEIFKYAGVEYQFGMGGLHTKDRPAEFNEDVNYSYIDVDADSYYPYLIINNNWEPKHLKGFFTPIYRLITETRIKAKHAAKDKLIEAVSRVKNKKLANILKIVINSSFGQFNDAYSFLYDPKRLYATTVNGQLGLLYVAEKIILAGQEVISVNTDGIVSKIKKTDITKYEEVSIKAFADFKATCEFTYYSKYVRTSVNDYVTIKTNGEVKLKGDFEYDKLNLHDGFSKGFSMPIVAYAVVKYFTKGISVQDTIFNHKDIYDFCKSSNIGNQFILQALSVINGELERKNIQDHVRYFISAKGVVLIKHGFDNNKEVRLDVGEYCTVFNDYYNVKSFKDYGVKYSYYVKEALKIINKVQRIDKKGLKYAGPLFN